MVTVWFAMSCDRLIVTWPIGNMATSNAVNNEVLALSGSSSEIETELETGRSHSQVRSLLDVLKAPEPSILARKRVVKATPPSETALISDSKNTLLSDGLKEFPNEGFKVNSSKKLFCEGCREVLSCSIETHTETKKHKKGKERLRQKTATEMDIAQAPKAYDNEQHPVGETLSESVRIYRVRVLMAMLRSGMAPDHFRDFLKENALAFTSVSNIKQLLPFVLRQETTRIKEAIHGK